MVKSTITRKYQTTIPREIREKLGVRLGDVLRWEILGNQVRVTVASAAFLDRRGSIKVGPGSVEKDILRSRVLRGTKR